MSRKGERREKRKEEMRQERINVKERWVMASFTEKRERSKEEVINVKERWVMYHLQITKSKSILFHRKRVE